MGILLASRKGEKNAKCVVLLALFADFTQWRKVVLCLLERFVGSPMQQI